MQASLVHEMHTNRKPLTRILDVTPRYEWRVATAAAQRNQEVAQMPVALVVLVGPGSRVIAAGDGVRAPTSVLVKARF
jgi:hypothetical protein